MSKNLYYIFSDKYALDGNLMFWKPNKLGYSPVLPEFGVYNEEEAIEICRNSTRAKAYKCEDVDKISRKALIFKEDLKKLTPVYTPGILLNNE